MRVQLWLAAFATLAAISPVIAAQDIEVVANSILRAYSDYCDPLYFDQNRAANAPVDATLTESFARVLFTRDGAQCNQFYNTEVAPASIVPALISRIPELQRALPRTLDSQQLALLGGILRYDDITEIDCGGKPRDGSDISGARSVAEPWWMAVGRDDALDLARGYIESESYAQAVVGFPSGGGTVTSCSAREIVGMMISMKLTGPIMPQGPGDGMSNDEFKQLMAQDDTEHASSLGENGATDYVWEPGDPGTNRTDDSTVDLSAAVSPEDIAAIKPFEGIWTRASGSCADPVDQVAIGQFDWQDGREAFGRGVPRIAAADVYCEVGLFEINGETSSFTTACFSEGNAESGRGSARFTSSTSIELQLWENTEPWQLTRCSVGN